MAVKVMTNWNTPRERGPPARATITTTPRPETARAANEMSCQTELAATVLEGDFGGPSITATGLRAIRAGVARNDGHASDPLLPLAIRRLAVRRRRALRPRDHCLEAVGDRRPGRVAEAGCGDARVCRRVSYVALLSASEGDVDGPAEGFHDRDHVLHGRAGAAADVRN